MLTPGPDHPITIEPGMRRWRARFANRVIADTDDALILREADNAPVIYFPRQDVAMEYMGRTDHRTHCPYKGDASYYTMTFAGDVVENVAWSYEDPADAVEEIRERIAFDSAFVEVYDVDDAAVNPHHREHHEQREEMRQQREQMRPRDDMMAREDVDDVIQHTDSGGGASQREHWEPNVSMPDREEGGLR